MCGMSANVDLVREGLGAFLRGDWERALSFAHPDVVSFRAPPLPDPQTYHGTAGMVQMYADWTSAFDEFEMEPIEFSEIGDCVVVEMINRGIGKASGVEVVGRFWFVYTVSDGQVVRQDAFASRQQAVAAAAA
jgi:ketosteroid isomerase-like protein